jgi:tRNA-specific 2-thiouridylase
VRIFIHFLGGEIDRASFTATGSNAAIAAGGILARQLTGLSWIEAAALPVARLEEAMVEEGIVNPRTMPAAAGFAVEALHRALEDSLRRGTFPVSPEAGPNTVLVAMSGGVDSAVACLLQQEAGRSVIGVTMRLWSDPACEAGENACCSPQAILDARAVCHQLGLPHLTVDCAADFEASVVEDFVSGYLAGRTPNPCTFCNAHFRFPFLARLAERLGAATVATGHYVGIITDETGRPAIVRGRDRHKDQSYMLWGIGAGLLPRLVFPLGEMEKAETRRLAREAGLPVHGRPESQEVCFIPDNDYRRFLRDRLRETPGALPGAGEIVDADGVRLGSHTGYLDYTIGQRHGLGVSAPQPVYVIGTDPGRNRVIVGRRDELAVSELNIDQLNMFLPLEETVDPKVQVRYNAEPVPCRLSGSGARWRLELERPVHGVAPGQSAVIYEGETIMAGGIITGTKPAK